ncbi:MAG: CHRD domain-containing protein [Thaumarchaeota archaeon]|nr:MAG: CHRD domain-containing protein [Nitrososphaerota archaeon]
MSYKKSLHLIVIASALLSLIIVATTNSNLTFAQNDKFKAKLKGDNEVPAVSTTATGKAKFKVKDDAITYKINITGITDVKMAHIHAGNEGENGDPIVDLLKSGNQNKSQDGVIIGGEITASDLEGSMSGKALTDLQSAMASEGTYVNIHTSEHPDGEIRGQIKVSGNATETSSLDATATG